MKKRLLSILTFAAVSVSFAASADDTNFSNSNHFEEKTGEALYKGICQGCHMPDAQGAMGAARYPALAGNVRLTSSPYMISIITNGQGGMPSFKRYLDDEQIAAVVNYTRTHFGNNFPDAVSLDDVKLITKR